MRPAPALITMNHTGSMFTQTMLAQHWKFASLRTGGPSSATFCHIDPIWRFSLKAVQMQERLIVTTYRDPLRMLASWKNRNAQMVEEQFLYLWEIWQREIAPIAYVFNPTDLNKREESLQGLEEYLGVSFKRDWTKHNGSEDRLGLQAALDAVEGECDEVRMGIFTDCGIFPQPLFIREVIRFGRD